jgi:Tol biopolymer transport system component
MKNSLFTLLCFTAVTLSAQSKKEANKYLDQEQPTSTPTVFAPGIVSIEDRYEYGNTFSNDGKEFYYSVNVGQKPQINVIRFENNSWSLPKTILVHEVYGYNDAFLSPDDKRLYFISDRALDGKGPKKDIDIWYVERKGEGWSEPVNAGESINANKNEYYISFTKKGTMFFSSNAGTNAATDKNYDVRTAEFTGGKFLPNKKLGGAINTEHYEADVFVSPDETYVIFCSERPGGKGAGDLYISFKNAKGEWLPAKNMGEAINTFSYEFCPYVTPDGKFLFFSRSGEIYWVSASVIEHLRD